MVALLAIAFALTPKIASAQLQAGRVDLLMPDTTHLNAEERALLRVESRRNSAIAARDTAALRTLYAPDLRAIMTIGSALTRDQLLATLAQNDPAATYEIDELTVHTLDAARTSAMLTGRVRTLIGKKTQAITRYIQVYQLRQGRWQIISAQSTAIVAR